MSFRSIPILIFTLSGLYAKTVIAGEQMPPTHLQIEVVKSIYHDALTSENPDDRRRYLREFLTKSEGIGDISGETNLWLLRAEAAFELNDGQKAWEAGQKLLAFHLDNSEDPKIQKIMVALERKDLLGAQSPQAKVEEQVKEQQDRLKQEALENKRKQISKYIGTWKFAGFPNVPEENQKYQGELVITADANFNLSASGHYSLTGTKMKHLRASGTINSIVENNSENNGDLPGSWGDLKDNSNFCPFLLVGSFTFTYPEDNIPSDSASKAFIADGTDKKLYLFIAGNYYDDRNMECVTFEKE